jgi:hypothetical protein
VSDQMASIAMVVSYIDESMRRIAMHMEQLAYQIEQPTIRDQVAMAALTGLLSGRADSDADEHGFAHDAYLFADAMMEARKEGRK